MSRKEKFSRSARKSKRHMADIQSEMERDQEQPEALPSRRKKFPSSKHKMTRIYYNLLFLLFVGLVVFLFWYGNEYTSKHH